MKKKIAILGSTGSIGKSTASIVLKNKKDFDVILLSTNKNLKELSKQCKSLKPKFLIINDYKSYLKFKKSNRRNNIKIFNNYNSIKRIFRKKIDYTINSISSFDGLKPTLDIIPFTKVIAIANKESIICGWNLIQSKIRKSKTHFIPIDSEHFSIWSLLNGSTNSNIEEVIITASGGPFLKLPLEKFKKIKPMSAVNHPNWKMGNKISIDSATLMNKVFEVIEAQRIFNIDLNKFKIFVHPSSYVHSVIKFNNGLTKMLVHDTNMRIPIFNSIYDQSFKKIITKKLDIKTLNNLKFSKPDIKRFPSISILKMVTNKNSLFETVLVSANDQLVDLFLEGKIKFQDIVFFLKKILRKKIFLKYKKKSPNNYNELINLSNYVRLKTRTLCI